MSNIRVKMRDGTERRFEHAVRAGGSYTKSLKYEPGFIVIEDEYGRRTSIPTDTVAEVIEEPHCRTW